MLIVGHQLVEGEIAKGTSPPKSQTGHKKKIIISSEISYQF